MLFPAAPIEAADELPKAELPKVLNPVSCFPEDDTAKSVVTFEEDPKLKRDGVCEDAATEEELLLVLEEVTGGVLVVILLLREAAVAAPLLLTPSDELQNVVWLV